MGSNWNLESQLLVAIQNDNLESARHVLIEKGLDADVRFRTGAQKRPAVCLCVERGNMPMVQLLLSKGCSINQADSTGFTALHIAASHGNPDLVALLLKHRANAKSVTAQGHTALHLAAQRPSVETVKMLVDAGMEMDRMDGEMKTALLHACIHGNEAVARFLAEKGANVNQSDTSGNTPLLYAINSTHFHIDSIALLIRHGALVNSTNLQGERPIHAAVRGRRPDKRHLLQLLKLKGCDVNARTKLGHTSLHLAILQHEYTTALDLIRGGCDVNLHDGLGLEPIFYAVKDGNYAITSLLIAAGAEIHLKDWLSERGLESNAKDPLLLLWLRDQTCHCHSLCALSRNVLQSHYKSTMEQFVSLAPLPLTLKKYLLLETL